MKKWGLSLLFLLCAALAGCGRITDGNVNALEVELDGTIRTSSVASFDKDYYDGEELESDINQTVRAYNKEKGAEDIALDSCTVKDGTAKIVMQYRTAEDYAAFNNVTFYSGTLAEAVSDGELERSAKVTPVGSGENETTVGAILDEKGKKPSVLILKEPLLVKIPGTIHYYSGTVKVEKDGTIQAGASDDSSAELDAPVTIIYY